MACKLPGVAVARYLELEAEATRAEADDNEADNADADADDAAATDEEEAMDDVTESASVVSAKRWSIRE